MTTPRTVRTPGQRAQEALDVAQRRLNRIDVELKKAKAAVATLEKDREAADRRHNYLAQNPDLPKVAAKPEAS